MIQQTKAIASQLETIVGPSSVHAWDGIDIDQQKPIISTVSSGTKLNCVVYPNTQEELAEIVACVHQNRWRVLACGNGSKLSWGGLVAPLAPPFGGDKAPLAPPFGGDKAPLTPPFGGDKAPLTPPFGGEKSILPPPKLGGQGGLGLVIISTARLNRVIEHAVGDLTLTVEAGAKLSDIQTNLAKENQFLALDPAYPQSATMGGIVATADAGSLRQRYGGVRDMLLGLSFVRYDGQIAKAGGRVVKNVAGYDLMKLFTGSFGTLGIISQVTFRLYPLPEASQTVVLTGTAGSIAQVAKTLLASALTPIAIDLLSTQLVTRLGLGKGMALITRFQSVAESVKEQSNRLLQVGESLGLEGSIFAENEEVNLWQRLQESMWDSAKNSAITCKIGVLPTAAVTALDQLDHTKMGMGLIHVGSGLGLCRFDDAEVKKQTILEMRNFCESHKGFLTVLEAPLAFKENFDVWGYSGNALDLMRRIKQQFDPENMFSPHRFVGGI